MNKLLLRIPEVCEITGLGHSTVYQLLDQPGGLQTVRVGQAVRVMAASVREWAERRCSQQAGERIAAADGS